jgi:hypothetical protein
MPEQRQLVLLKLGSSASEELKMVILYPDNRIFEEVYVYQKRLQRWYFHMEPEDKRIFAAKMHYQQNGNIVKILKMHYTSIVMLIPGYKCPFW